MQASVTEAAKTGMNNLKIVRACAEHIDDLVEVEKLSFKIPWSRQSLIDEIVNNSMAVYYSALSDGKAVGYAGMWQVLDEGHITNIAVHPEFRRSGVGSQLLNELLKEARRRGIKALTLEVRKSNEAAKSLYRKYGFEEGGLRKAYYADNNEDAIIMWTKL